ncbi:hypothetical protein ASC80_05550 [Afipia sp. Root123D2]|uniref:hypothetical protein n=1 Tax=Afipia sp. Root123D2 TaxID=1736436 RepID=UPI0006FCB6AC|nr:hypothetical protein [Afipia sp. Root123D2]KQW22805.1 hypothetical protein ASC80_05550 [Afipia sp. Root123D2]
MDTLSWLFNFVPWWVWVVIAAVLLAVFWQALLPVWLTLPKWLKGIILGAGALFTAYAAGRNRGSKDEREQRAKADARAVQTRKETDDEIRNAPAADVDRRLDGWMRD